jgi:hypothetical protein
MGQTNRQTENKLQIKALCALVFSLWVIPASALDLGRLQIFSAIGEPLRAEVEIAQAAGARAILVGETLVRSGDPKAKIDALLGTSRG